MSAALSAGWTVLVVDLSLLLSLMILQNSNCLPPVKRFIQDLGVQCTAKKVQHPKRLCGQ